jgi:superfamily II DNA or RNA helicase/HKD family nuclease
VPDSPSNPSARARIAEVSDASATARQQRGEPTLSPGLYDAVVTPALLRQLDAASLSPTIEPFAADVASDAFARHIGRLIAATLGAVSGKPDEKLQRQVAIANRVLAALHNASGVVDPDDAVSAQRLLAASAPGQHRLGAAQWTRPSIPLRFSDLIVNGPNDLRVGREIERELASADRVDVLVSFVKWTGFVELHDALRRFRERFGDALPLRVLTTTYMGATDARALDALEALGAKVRVSYDERRTRLHAKAWLFHRATGYSTGIVGSSNLSKAALRDGCEWNVRLSNVDNPEVLRKFEATFEQYWEDGAFEPYDRDRFLQATQVSPSSAYDALVAIGDLQPYPHQREVLDALSAERAAGHLRNLVVAATGTGKTVIAALDYAALVASNGGQRPTLLFVAHRREILEKSRATYRKALRDPSFGELLTGRDQPLRGTHVFANIQSLHANRLQQLARDAYAVVVVDEFHHAEAATYDALLAHLTPMLLLGLTATPERADGQSVLYRFGDRIAAESRLWDALDQGLLVPFQYFGIDDETDLSQVDFSGGRYDVSALERLYTADDHRARQVIRAVSDRVLDPMRMRALGFCVSVAHAEYMAAVFVRHGLPAVAVTGSTPAAARREAVAQLSRGELCALFSVDVFNEGVDIPMVDTVLFLRPTESATLFLQQLGRGLRLAEGKSCLTVLDFVGRPHRKFRFDRRFRALLGGGTRRELEQTVNEGFPRLPAGCSIQLEERAQAAVIENLRASLGDWGSLREELAEDWPLAAFIARTGIALDELYRAGKSFTGLRAACGFIEAQAPTAISRALPRVLHVDDTARLQAWSAWLAASSPPVADATDPMQRLLFATLGQASHRPVTEMAAFWSELWSNAALRDELRQLFALLDDQRRRPTYAVAGLPLHVHATYTRDEISAALGEVRKGKLLRTQSGVLCSKRNRCDVLYVTLQKDEQHFTPTTRYNDYPLSHRRFHWESQSATRAGSPTALRYQSPPEDWRVLLFVRATKYDARGLTMPYVHLGPVRCVSATGDRPLQIVWELEHAMPPSWYRQVKIAAA